MNGRALAKLMIYLYGFILGIEIIKKVALELSGSLTDLITIVLNNSPLKAISFVWLSTAVVQSSGSIDSIIAVLTASGVIPLQTALYIIMGTGIGTTITALSGSVGANIAGRRLALAQLLFNFITGLVALSFIFPLADVVDSLSELILSSVSVYTL